MSVGDLAPGWDTGASDYIRIKYVVFGSLERCLHVLSTGEFLRFKGDEVFTPEGVMEDRPEEVRQEWECHFGGIDGIVFLKYRAWHLSCTLNVLFKIVSAGCINI